MLKVGKFIEKVVNGSCKKKRVFVCIEMYKDVLCLTTKVIHESFFESNLMQTPFYLPSVLFVVLLLYLAG